MQFSEIVSQFYYHRYCIQPLFRFENNHIVYFFQQSKKLAAIKSSNAISGAIGNSGISVELFVYRTL